MTISRRQFLTAAGAGITAPVWLRLSGFADAASALAAAPAGPGRLLLTIFLQGGNDGLNTVVPYLDPEYRRLRGDLALAESEILPLGGGLGLHNALPYLHQQYAGGRVAIVPRVGVAKPDFSHFVSTATWETGSPAGQFASGWLGRYLDRTEAPSRGPVRALAMASNMPVTIAGERVTGVAASALNGFDFPDAQYPDGQLRHRVLAEFGAGARNASMRSTVVDRQQGMLAAVQAIRNLASATTPQTTAAEAIVAAFAAGLGTEVGFLTIDGFDTHTHQRGLHGTNLRILDSTIKAFFDAAQARNVASRAAVLVFSEFGRRVGVNGSSGSDHGAAGPVFLIGPTVRGGVVGDRGDLSRLDDGNVPAQFDLRQVYASVLEQHLDTAADPILAGRFQQLPLFTTARTAAPATAPRRRRP